MKKRSAKKKSHSAVKPNAPTSPYDYIRLKPNCSYFRDPIFPDIMVCQHDSGAFETVDL